MRNPFSYRSLFLTLVILLGSQTLSYGQHETFKARSIDLTEAVSEGLYHNALSSTNPYEALYSNYELDRQRVLSLLHTYYPELSYELERTPKQTLKGKDIANLLVSILESETVNGVNDLKNSFWSLTEGADLTKEDKATFQFLYGYELFKQKRFAEAKKIFNGFVKNRKGPYEHALYYGGLIDLINKDFEGAHEQLTLIGKDELLKLHTPYYLAAANYGNKNYNDVLKFYELRINHQHLHNINGITQLVAFSQFKTGKFESAIASLNVLEDRRALTAEESYVLGIAFQKTGKQELSSQYLSTVAASNTELDLNIKAKYETALNLSAQGKNQEALQAFEALLNDKNFDKNEIVWNLAILNGRLSNYDKMAFHAKALLETNKKTKAVRLLSSALNEIENEALYTKVINDIHKDIEDKDFIKQSIYGKALAALKRQDKTTAKRYFDLMADVDPLVEERGVVAAWKGIMAFEDGDYRKSIRLLTNYKNAKNASAVPNKLDFDAAYFLGYALFKQKDHNQALGHFSQALALSQKNNIAQELSANKGIESDLYLRMGDSYFLINEYGSATRAYNNAVDKGTIQKDYAIWQKSIIAELEGKPYDQVILLEEIISDYNQSPYFHRAIFSTANALFEIQKYDKAAEFYNRLLTVGAPVSMQEESIAQLGLINVNAGDYDKAENYFKQLIDQSKNEEIVYRANLALQEIYKDYKFDTDAYVDLIASNATEKEDTKVDQVLYDLAIEKIENGLEGEAITLFNKLIQEHPKSTLIAQSYFQLGETYANKKSWIPATNAFQKVTSYPISDQTTLAFDKAEAISYLETKDYNLYLKLREKRMETFPNTAASTQDLSREFNALLKTDNTKTLKKKSLAVFSNNDININKKKEMLKEMSELMITKREWAFLSKAYNIKSIQSIVNKDPKLIYERGLVYFNNSELDLAATSITDHYDTLLGDPAWLAKGIILISDVYVLKDDKDSAAAALEALISTQSAVPPVLIDIAKNRLKALELQN